MKRLAAALALVAFAAEADTVWKNQGTTLGPATIANCSGTGITCTRVANQVNISVAGDGGTFAPVNASYIVEVPDSSLTNEFAMSTLASGLVMNTTGTGVPSIYPGQACSLGSFAHGLTSLGALTCSVPAGGITDVTATPPLFSTGTTTKNITCAEASAISSGCLPLVNGDLMIDAGLTVIYATNGIAHVIVDNASNGTAASTRLQLRGGLTDAGVSIQSGLSQYSAYFGDTIPAFVATLHTFTNEPRGMGFTLSSLIADEPGAAWHWYEREGAATYQEVMKLERTGALRALIADGGVVRGRITGTKDCAGTSDVGCITTDGTNMLASLKWDVASGGTNNNVAPASEVPYGNGTAYVWTTGSGANKYMTHDGTKPGWSDIPTPVTPTVSWSAYCPKGICTDGEGDSDNFLMPLTGVTGDVFSVACNVGIQGVAGGGTGELIIQVYNATDSSEVCHCQLVNPAPYQSCATSPGLEMHCGCTGGPTLDRTKVYVVRFKSTTDCATIPGQVGCTVQFTE